MFYNLDSICSFDINYLHWKHCFVSYKFEYVYVVCYGQLFVTLNFGGNTIQRLTWYEASHDQCNTFHWITIIQGVCTKPLTQSKEVFSTSWTFKPPALQENVSFSLRWTPPTFCLPSCDKIVSCPDHTLLTLFLVVLSQQFWFLNNDYMYLVFQTSQWNNAVS